MPYKDLEHEGDEDFSEGFPTRKETKIILKNLEEEIEKNKDKELETAQAEWMNPNNPFLWEGEI